MEPGYAFLTIFLIGCVSLIGVFMISVKEKTLDKILIILVAFATGTILATAAFDLIPEATHEFEAYYGEGSILLTFAVVMIGFTSFFIIERFIYWFHGHAHQDEESYVCHGEMPERIGDQVNGRIGIKNFAILNLVGDGLHNFLDGIVIMVAFLNGTVNGIVVTLAVLFHEIPQEIGDFGILVYGGFSKKRALFFNFLSGMVSLLGGLLAFLLSGAIDSFNMFFLAFSGGGFLYLACTELMPELIKERNVKKSVIQTLIFIVGLVFIFLLIMYLPHE